MGKYMENTESLSELQIYWKSGLAYAEEVSFRLGYFYGFIEGKDDKLSDEDLNDFRMNSELDKFLSKSYRRGFHHGYMARLTKRHTQDEVFSFLKEEEPEGFQP